jgi:hypothetical protein
MIEGRDRVANPNRMDVKIVVLMAILSWLFGCARKPEPTEPPPEKPGTSFPLHYPVMFFGGLNIHVRDDEQSFITTSISTGLFYPDFKLVDSDAVQYTILKETPFGKTSGFFDMGTKRYQVFLKLKREGVMPLQKIKDEVLKVALQENGEAAPPRGPRIATEKIQGAKTIGELIDRCSRPWEWR